MNCEKCNRHTLIPTKISGKQYCSKHFEELMEKRIRKYLRIQNKLNTKLTYSIESNNKENEEILKFYLESIFNKRLKLTKITKNTVENRIISTQTADEIASEFINEFIDDKNTKNNSKIKPLSHITNKELSELKKIHKIKMTNTANSQNILQKLEEKYTGTIFSVIKTKEFLNHR